MENYLLGLVLLICVITDIRNRKILNVVTLPAVVIGIVYHSWMSGWNGFLFSGTGFLVGLALLLIPYLLGGMGAGDVKLMAAIGALTGAYFVFYAFFYTAIAGGIIAVLLLLYRQKLLYTLKQIVWNIWILSNWKMSNGDPALVSFPYGVAIALGTLVAGVWGGWR